MSEPSITEFLTQRWDEQEHKLELVRKSHGAVSGSLKLFVAEFGPAYVLADIAAKRRTRCTLLVACRFPARVERDRMRPLLCRLGIHRWVHRENEYVRCSRCDRLHERLYKRTREDA